MTLRRALCGALVALLGATLGCSSGDDSSSSGGAGGQTGQSAKWSQVFEDLPGAMLSVWGTSATDVWMVGGDARDGTGPMVIHFDGSGWTRVPTGQTAGDLWWVFGFEGGPIFMGGSGGVILRYDGGTFTLMPTPTTDTVFGLWGSSPDDMWAVGGASDAKSGFAWRLSDSWKPEPTLPESVGTSAAVWKVFGRSASDAWLVGSSGVSLHWDGTALTQEDTGVGSSLFTVHATSERYAAVGGLASGIIVENDGSGWTNVTPTSAQFGLTGVALSGDSGGFAVGQYGGVFSRSESGWQEETLGFDIYLDLHGVWIDPSGGVWAVGGQTGNYPLVQGLVIHKGDSVPAGGL